MQNNYKNLIFLFFILIQFQLYSQEINWMSLDEVREAQKTNPKNVLIDVYTNWCGPCKLMDRNTFSNTDIIRIINENYYAAVALAMFHSGRTDSKKIKIKTKGGELTVEFDTSELGYNNIKLIGKVEMIFSGEIEV